MSAFSDQFINKYSIKSDIDAMWAEFGNWLEHVEAPSTSNGIAPLKKDGQTLLTEVGKANALNDQFQSVFSPKNPISLKSLAQKSLQELHGSGANLPFQPSPHPKMPDISIAAEGIDKLLKGLSPHKAAGPDKFKPIVLQTLHKELAPILQLIFQRSIDTGKIPDIWKEANVSQIYKKAKNLTHPTTGQSH